MALTSPPCSLLTDTEALSKNRIQMIFFIYLKTKDFLKLREILIVLILSEVSFST
jgi:hypothetical protein